MSKFIQLILIISGIENRSKRKKRKRGEKERSETVFLI
jgi:hypothetical protein